jgi:recombination protein RecT
MSEQNGSITKSVTQTLGKMLEDRKDSLSQLVPKHLTPDRLIKVALNAVAKTPQLQQCTASSLLRCVITAAELGLEPGGALGHAYLVPFKTDATLIIGYRGFIELMRRSGELTQIEAHVVHANDKFEIEHGLEPKLRHVPALGDPGEPKLAYVIARLVGGGLHVEMMTWDAIMKIKARSRASSSGPWVTDTEEMAKKTVVRRAAKYLPVSSERYKRALEHEEDDFIDGEVTPVALPSDTDVVEQIVRPGNAKARAAIARPMEIIDEPSEVAEPGAAG